MINRRAMPAIGLAGLCFATFIVVAQNLACRADTNATDDPLPPLLRGVHRIVCLGDSITEAGGQPGGYVTLLKQYLGALYPSQGIEIVNAGISGHKATDMQARFQKDVLDKKPDLVTISVGVNDVWHGFYDNHPAGDGPRGVPLAVYREKLLQMVDAAKAANAKVLMVSPTLIHEDLTGPENAKLDTYVAEMHRIAKERGCAFVDLNATFKAIVLAYQKRAGRTSNLLTTDGVHMNAAGNRVMAYGILRALGVPDKSIANLKLEK